MFGDDPPRYACRMWGWYRRQWVATGDFLEEKGHFAVEGDRSWEGFGGFVLWLLIAAVISFAGFFVVVGIVRASRPWDILLSLTGVAATIALAPFIARALLAALILLWALLTRGGNGGG